MKTEFTTRGRDFASRYSISVLIFFFGLGTCFAAAGGAPESLKNKDSRILTASAAASPSRTLHVQSNEADLTIIAGRDDAVSAEGIVEVSDADKDIVQYFLDNTKIALEPASDGLTLRLLSPMDVFDKPGARLPRTGIFARFYKGNKFVFKMSFTARLTVRVPARQSMAWQEGQNPRLRQENITSRSSAQSGHRMRTNPQRGLPQSRYRSTTSLTMGLRKP